MSENTDAPPAYTRSCDGYVYFADQGIKVCESCDGSTCCDFADVDHRNARYRCLLDREGAKCLIASSAKLDHDCERDRPSR